MAGSQPVVKASEFEIASVQAVIFTPDTKAFSPQKALTDFIGNHGSRYNGPVTALPLPEDAPPQLPRVLLQSVDNVWRLSAAPVRIDSAWNPPGGVAPVGDLERTVNECSRVLAEYVERNGVVVGRLALVVMRAARMPHPAQVLIDRFSSKETKRSLLNNSQAFEVHNLKRYHMPSTGFEINSWVRCRTGVILNEPCIAVENDLNTPEEELNDRTLDAREIRDFFAYVQREAYSIMQQYFPEGD